jgi:hypothetical protein
MSAVLQAKGVVEIKEAQREENMPQINKLNIASGADMHRFGRGPKI